MENIQSVAVLVDRWLDEWEVKALENMVSETGVDIPLVIVQDPPTQQEPLLPEGHLGGVFGQIRAFFHVFSKVGPWAFVMAERKIGRTISDTEQNYNNTYYIDDINVFSESEKIYCTPIPSRGADPSEETYVSDHWKELPDDVVDRIVDETDVVVRIGWGLIEGRILKEPEYGVLSFHASDIRRYRGLASTERFLDDPDEAGATLQRLNDAVDGGDVVHLDFVDVSDAYTLDEIQGRAKLMQAEMLPEGLIKLDDPDIETEVPEDLAEYTTTKKKFSYLYCARVAVRDFIGHLKTTIRR